MERRVFFLCLLSLLMFAEGVSWLTAGGLGPCLVKPEHGQQAADRNEHQDCPTFLAGTLLVFQRGVDLLKRDDNDKAVVAGFTIVLAVSTIGLWLATNKLWEAGERQLKHLGDTAALELRAYVSVESGEHYRQSQRRRMVFEFRPVIKNNGLTPANNVQIRSLIDVVPPTIPRGFNYTTERLADLPMTSVTTIGPRQHRFHSRVMWRNLSIQELREVRRGNKCFHVWGAVLYDDIFGQSHCTNFSFMIFVGGKREGVVWHNTQENNDAT